MHSFVGVQAVACRNFLCQSQESTINGRLVQTYRCSAAAENELRSAAHLFSMFRPCRRHHGRPPCATQPAKASLISSSDQVGHSISGNGSDGGGRKSGLRGRNHPYDGDKSIPPPLLVGLAKRLAAKCAEMTNVANSRYWRLNMRFRVLALVAAVLVALSLLLVLLDAMFSTYGTASQRREAFIAAATTTSSFAVVINTYKRPDRLHKAVSHYAETCGTEYSVEQVFVVWSELGVVPPAADSFFTAASDAVGVRGGQSSTLPAQGSDVYPVRRRSEVVVIRSEKDSLNSRFLPIKDLRTDSIFMVDDDVRVACSSLLHGFRAWQLSPDSMVGYYPRLASSPLFSGASSDSVAGGKRMVYHTFPIVILRGMFNMVLTKACFLHSKYLELYSGDVHPQEIRDYIDQHKNCEDVAMSLLVANATRSTDAAPIYVEGSVTDTGLFGGISTGAGHMRTRSDCLDDITRIYAEHGWDMPLFDVSLSEGSWLRHYPGFRYQIRPSNFFEWFSFGNFLT